LKAVREQAHWTLFNPSEVTDLHDLYGSAFERRYTEYEKNGPMMVGLNSCGASRRSSCGADADNAF